MWTEKYRQSVKCGRLELPNAVSGEVTNGDVESGKVRSVESVRVSCNPARISLPVDCGGPGLESYANLRFDQRIPDEGRCQSTMRSSAVPSKRFQVRKSICLVIYQRTEALPGEGPPVLESAVVVEHRDRSEQAKRLNVSERQFLLH